MLSMLRRISLSRSKQIFSLNNIIVVGLALVSLPLHGADLLPVGPLDATGKGHTASPRGVPKGGVLTKISTESFSSVDVSNNGNDREKRISNLGRTHLLLGLGLSRRMSLTLGVSGTQEQLATEQRLTLFPPDRNSGENGNNRSLAVGSFAFASASLSVKFSLFDRSDVNGFSVAVMPFLESGAGDKATFAVTRSIEPRGGAALLAAYRVQEMLEVATQMGIRYRSPESVMGQLLRHELFYQASASLVLGGGVSLFGEGEGRQLMVAAVDQESGLKQAYRPTYGGAGRLGLAMDVGSLSVAVFGGRRLGPDTAIGFGSRTLGASVSWAFGKASPDSRELSYATRIEREEERKAALKKGSSGNIQHMGHSDHAYPEMIGAEIDPLEVLGPEGAPDFKDIKKRMEDERKNAEYESEHARVERELRELKEAEAQAAREREKEDAKEAESERKDALERMKEDNKNFKKWVDEANQELGEINGIQKEDLEWNGLEDPE
jgi:hypothetical protein